MTSSTKAILLLVVALLFSIPHTIHAGGSNDTCGAVYGGDGNCSASDRDHCCSPNGFAHCHLRAPFGTCCGGESPDDPGEWCHYLQDDDECCGGATPYCQMSGSEGTCVQCMNDSQCPSGETCSDEGDCVKPPHELDLHILDDDGKHCHELQALDNTTACFTTYWAAHSYQFKGYVAGLCPAKFTSTDETNTICPPNNVVARIHGILPPAPGPAPAPTPGPGPTPGPSPEPRGCKALGGVCTGNKTNPQGSCCNNAFCKYWQTDPAGRTCMGCYTCKCATGGPGTTDDPQKCVGGDGKLCPSTKNC